MNSLTLTFLVLAAVMAASIFYMEYRLQSEDETKSGGDDNG